MWGAQTIFNVSGGYYLIFDDACRGAYYAPASSRLHTFYMGHRGFSGGYYPPLHGFSLLVGAHEHLWCSLCAPVKVASGTGQGPFFLAKGALLKNIPPGYFSINPRKCALRQWGFRPLRWATQRGFAPLDSPPPFIKGGRKF